MNDCAVLCFVLDLLLLLLFFSRLEFGSKREVGFVSALEGKNPIFDRIFDNNNNNNTVFNNISDDHPSSC